jgi:LmbE family N-acetylglucosaminyl deacetylase
MRKDGQTLRGRVIVVSPHLDDAIFSLGATIASASRSGTRIEVLTVFGCDPDSDAPAKGWDARGGFATEGEAARGRREEDRAACRQVGAEPRWLPFRGGGYTPHKDKTEISAAIETEVREVDSLLVPGFPLKNPDHAWLANLFEGQSPVVPRLGRYVEQPYAYLSDERQPLPAANWQSSPLTLADRLSKRRAVLAYASQLPLLSLGTRKLNLLMLQREAISWSPR